MDKLEKEFYKLKQDVISYNEDGTISSQAYSKDVIEQRKKNIERRDKIKAVLEKALDRNDWSDIGSVTQSK